VLVNAAAIKPGIAMDATAEDSLDALVREHARLVFRIAFSVLRNHHDAEDAAQETFLRVLRQGQPLEAVADPKAWLARIAWRVALDRIRRTPRDGEEDWSVWLDQLRAPGASAEQLASDAQMLRLTLSTVEELNSREIAEILGIPEGTVRTRLQRARQTLKEKLTELMKGGRR
jgi:RNA polymerase sigma-70 factor (ECF subfamily)